MKKHTIAIVGGGACGVATFVHLVLKLVIEPLPAQVSLHIIEKNNEFGPGLAYGTGQQGHLLNTSARLMGIFAEEPLHFVEWMEENRQFIDEHYPGTEIHPEGYPPRNLYGHYLKTIFEEYSQLAQQHGIDVVRHGEEAIDASIYQKSVRLKLASGESLRADVVVLATGTPRSNNFNHLEVSPNYLDSPWPAERLLNTVADKTASVCVLGASLTAIDAAISLIDNGHTGPIKFYSKDGLLPRVQSPEEAPFERKHLTVSNIRKFIRQNQRTLRIKDLFRLFLDEAEEVLGKQRGWKDAKRVDQPHLALLEEDIHLALKGENHFQNILYATRYESFEIWQLLPTDQKLLFIKWLKSLSDINRHAIPLQNAKKLQKLLKSGQLTIKAHSKDLTWEPSKKQFIASTEDGKTEAVDYVINATGPATALEKMDIPLLQQLGRKKKLVPYAPGGVRADVHTMQLEVPGLLDPPLYGIGHLLVGELFDTNSVWFNVARIDPLTNAILKRLKHGSPSKLSTNVVPLYLFIGLGYIASRWWGLPSKPISKILLYALIPLVIFDNLLKAELSQVAIVAGTIFLLALLMNGPAILAGRYFGKDMDQNVLNCSYSYFNVGWFGIPVVMALFGEEKMPLIISAYMGNVLYGDTVGYYLVSRSKDLPVSDSVKNVLKIPAIYAGAAALIANAYGVEMPDSLEPVAKGASWTLSALGMLIIGITLTDIDFKKVDYARFGKLLGVRYLAAAALLGALVWAESLLLGQLDGDEQKLLLLIASFPIAANLVVFATYLEAETEDASLLVALSSLISLLLVPAICLLLFQ